ncbi:MAG TPA: GlsB/YeaQ/YmgE family stress response membrane protein [Ignavibacteriaceae bacterium]|nr:GlsB/YeaQ/YmgE family stress response membrane protein [Ignavibacteriaceae bacterium]
MSIIWAIIIGFVAGLIAKAIMPGRDPGGFFITALLGIVGAVVFTFLGRALGFYHEGESAGFIGAVIGAILLLWIYRLFVGRRRIV